MPYSIKIIQSQTNATFLRNVIPSSKPLHFYKKNIQAPKSFRKTNYGSKLNTLPSKKNIASPKMTHYLWHAHYDSKTNTSFEKSHPFQICQFILNNSFRLPDFYIPTWRWQFICVTFPSTKHYVSKIQVSINKNIPSKIKHSY